MKYLILPILICISLIPISAQSDAGAIVLMSVSEIYTLGRNTQNKITINYPGTGWDEEVIPLQRRSQTGNQHINKAAIAEAINKIVSMGYELQAMDTDRFENSHYNSSYVFVRKEE